MIKNDSLECKYIVVFPIFLLLCSAVILWATLVVGFSASTITGIILLVVGVLMLIQPIIVFRPHAIEWRNLIGRAGRTVTYEPDTIEIKDNKVFIDGRKQFGLWMVNVNADTVTKYLESNRSA